MRDEPEVDRVTLEHDGRVFELGTMAEFDEAAERLQVVSRLTRYATKRPNIDRARQLEAISGDVVTALADAQLAADLGDWEAATEKLKIAKSRVADGGNLAKAVHDRALRHSRGAQLALPEVE